MMVSQSRTVAWELARVAVAMLALAGSPHNLLRMLAADAGLVLLLLGWSEYNQEGTNHDDPLPPACADAA